MKDIQTYFIEARRRSTCNNIAMAAVVETLNGEVILGWNGPPARAGDHLSCLLGGPITSENLRKCPSVHAEVRAICRAAENGVALEGGTIYLSEWFPCLPCAIAIIEAGLSTLVITEEINFTKDDCYNFQLAHKYLADAGVEIRLRPELSLKNINKKFQ